MATFLPGDPTVVVRAPDLSPFRRGARWLVLAPRTGASILLEGSRLRLFGSLATPIPVARLHERHPELPASEIRELLEELQAAGMLVVAGRAAAPPSEPPPPPGLPARLSLRLVEGCSPQCPACAALPGERRALGPDQARRAVEEGLDALPAGRVRLDVTGGEPLAAFEALEAALLRAREIRPGTALAVRTQGVGLGACRAARLHELGAEVLLVLHEAPGQPGAEEGLLADRAREALGALPEILATGLSCAPLGVVRRPGQALALFRLLMGLGYRTLGLELSAPPADLPDRDARLEALAEDLLAVADAVRDHEARTPVRVRVHPLEAMMARLRAGFARADCGHPECGAPRPAREVGLPAPAACAKAPVPAEEVHPRCPRCPFWRVCRGGCRFARGSRDLDARCRLWLGAYEGLLWRMHEDPAWMGRHRDA